MDGVRSRVLVAVVEGHVVAVAASEIADASSAELSVLYVLGAFQRSGVGRRIVHAELEHFSSIGLAAVRVAVLAANTQARQFYESLGAREVGERHDPDGLEVVYAWSLDGDS